MNLTLYLKLCRGAGLVRSKRYCTLKKWVGCYMDLLGYGQSQAQLFQYTQSPNHLAASRLTKVEKYFILGTVFKRFLPLDQLTGWKTVDVKHRRHSCLL